METARFQGNALELQHGQRIGEWDSHCAIKVSQRKDTRYSCAPLRTRWILITARFTMKTCMMQVQFLNGDCTKKKNYRRRILVVWTRALTTAKLSLWKVRDSFDRSPGDLRTITLQNYSLDSWSYHIQTITVEVSDSFEINPDHIKTVALHR